MSHESSPERLRSDGILILGVLLALAPVVRGDVILLRGGGELQGKVISDARRPGSVQVLQTRGRKPLTFRKEQILEVVPRPGPLDDYVAKRAQLGPKSTAQDEYDIGLWCQTNRLTDLANVH